jgi:hypothetical protein
LTLAPESFSPVFGALSKVANVAEGLQAENRMLHEENRKLQEENRNLGEDVRRALEGPLCHICNDNKVRFRFYLLVYN